MIEPNTPTPEAANALSYSDLRAALSGTVTETPKTPPAVTPAVTPPPAEAEEGTIEEPKEGVEPPAAVEPPQGDKKGPPPRFSKVTKDRDAALARAEAAEREVAALRAGAAAKPAEQAPGAATGTTDVEPVYPEAENFNGTWQELEAARKQYAKDLAKFEVKQALRQSAAEAQAAQQQAQAQQVQATFQQQVDAALDAHGEAFDVAFKEVGAALRNTGVADIVKESPVAAELILELHKDKALLEKLPTLTLARRATEVAKIEARIEAAKGTTGTAATVTTPVKPLPKPPAVIGGAAGSDPTAPKLEEITDFRQFKQAVTKARAK